MFKIDLTNKVLLDGIANNPDSRYHIINFWQYQQFLPRVFDSFDDRFLSKRPSPKGKGL